ncbi:MAG: hypothetical protein Q8N99_05085 [Nanoarchaeota archaeon]|nr:hypothetical protein [Nanoarchaeota archaeon]
MEIDYRPDLGGYTTIGDIPIDIIKKNENLDHKIEWISFRNSELFLRFDTGEAPSGCMWGPCHLPIGFWLNYGLSVDHQKLHTKLIHQDNLTTLLARNRTILFYRWMDPRDKVFADQLKSLKSIVDEINPGEDFFHDKFFGALYPFSRYRKLKDTFSHKDIAEYYKKYAERLGNLEIDARYIGDVREGVQK